MYPRNYLRGILQQRWGARELSRGGRYSRETFSALRERVVRVTYGMPSRTPAPSHPCMWPQSFGRPLPWSPAASHLELRADSGCRAAVSATTIVVMLRAHGIISHRQLTQSARVLRPRRPHRRYIDAGACQWASSNARQFNVDGTATLTVLRGWRDKHATDDIQSPALGAHPSTTPQQQRSTRTLATRGNGAVVKVGHGAQTRELQSCIKCYSYGLQATERWTLAIVITIVRTPCLFTTHHPEHQAPGCSQATCHRQLA